MIDITNYLNEYREAVRHLWNTHFRCESGLIPDDDSFDSFEAIKQCLYDALVLGKLGNHNVEHKIDWEAAEFLHVIPDAPDGASILINRSTPASGYWDDPISRIRQSDFELHFIGYFDWTNHDYIDLRYYRVKIAVCLSHPYLVGREALLETFCAKVFSTEV